MRTTVEPTPLTPPVHQAGGTPPTSDNPIAEVPSSEVDPQTLTGRGLQGNAREPRSSQDMLSDGSFMGAVQALSQALGDPTRREIYLYVREHGTTTAQTIGRQFRLHPNVARHHRDRLAASGYLEVTLERTSPSQVGRPSKHYRSTGVPVLVDSLGEQANLLGRLLARALEMLDRDSAERLAYEVGLDYGHEIGLQMSGQEATKSIATSLKLVADALTRSGFSSREDSYENSLGLRNRSCPFGALVADHPVLCVTERGIIQGLLESLAVDGDLARVEPRRGGTTGCEVRIHPAHNAPITIRTQPRRPAAMDYPSQ